MRGRARSQIGKLEGSYLTQALVMPPPETSVEFPSMKLSHPERKVPPASETAVVFSINEDADARNVVAPTATPVVQLRIVEPSKVPRAGVAPVILTPVP